MKLKSPLFIITALLGVTIATSLAGDPSAKSKAEKPTAKAKASPDEAIPGAEAKPAAYFYTGKPYDEDLGGYVFNYRTYSPLISRWMTADPSGFPDGANNAVYAPVPTSELDFLGLHTQKRIAWVAVKTSYGTSAEEYDNGNGVRRSLGVSVTDLFQSMLAADLKTSNNPHYMNDTDVFNNKLILVNDIADINDLNNGGIKSLWKRFDKIVLFSHGFWGGVRGYEMQANFQGNRVKVDVFGNHANDVYYATCANAHSPNPVGGDNGSGFNGQTSIQSVVQGAVKATKDYLLE